MTSFRRFVQTVLTDAGLPASPAAVELLTMIAAHESGGFLYVRQISGPALGLYQMERPAFRDVQRYIAVRPERFGHLIDLEDVTFPYLNFDQRLATQAARIYLMMEPEPLPHPDDCVGLARYCKTHWNTPAGKATEDDYLSDFERYA